MLKRLLLWMLDKVLLLLLYAWTTPENYTAGQLIDETAMDKISANLNALKAPPSDQYENFSCSLGVSGTTFADVDATELNLSITTTGGDVEIVFSVVFSTSGAVSSPEYIAFDVLVDGTTRIGDTTLGMIRTGEASRLGDCSFRYNKTGLSAGAHTFKLQAKETAAATITVVSVFFLVRETT